MSNPTYIKPTETELEILNILWQKKTASVRDVHEQMAKNKEIGYTTTLKLMQIMHEKGLLTRDKSSKVHIYTAALAQATAQKEYMNKMLTTLFNGSAAEMVLQALGNHSTSKEELKEIEAFLKTKA